MEINMRKFPLSPGTKLLGDDRHQADMVEAYMPGCVYVEWNDTDDDHVEARIYQYYSFAPIYGMEANFLRRLEVGKSVVSVNQGISRYIGGRHVPEWIKKGMIWYLCCFLNSMDYIVVPDCSLREELQKEGIRSPQIRVIPSDEVCGEGRAAAQWLKLYEQMWEPTNLQYPYQTGYILQGNR